MFKQKRPKSCSWQNLLAVPLFLFLLLFLILRFFYPEQAGAQGAMEDVGTSFRISASSHVGARSFSGHGVSP